LIRIKRVYEPPEKDDGFRILVDRLWPRGMSKKKAKLNMWMKEIAPSDELRSWFNHDPDKWEEFQKKYGSELSEKGDLIQQVMHLEKNEGTVTLVFAAKDEEHNNAVVLKEVLQGKKHS
jgi:uncharacterized protein YeaO (DUF488 family)